MKKSIDKKFYTVRELADLMKISRIAVFKKVQKGQIKADRVGKTYLISSKEAAKFFSDGLTDKLKKEIENGVKKVIKEYGETLKLLGKE